jgi:hypothetical protein
MAAIPFNLTFEDSLAKSGHWSTMLGEESGDQSACLISSAVFLTNLKPLPPHCILLQMVDNRLQSLHSSYMSHISS